MAVKTGGSGSCFGDVGTGSDSGGDPAGHPAAVPAPGPYSRPPLRRSVCRRWATRGESGHFVRRTTCPGYYERINPPPSPPEEPLWNAGH